MIKAKMRLITERKLNIPIKCHQIKETFDKWPRCKEHQLGKEDFTLNFINSLLLTLFMSWIAVVWRCHFSLISLARYHVHQKIQSHHNHFLLLCWNVACPPIESFTAVKTNAKSMCIIDTKSLNELVSLLAKSTKSIQANLLLIQSRLFLLPSVAIIFQIWLFLSVQLVSAPRLLHLLVSVSLLTSFFLFLSIHFSCLLLSSKFIFHIYPLSAWKTSPAPWRSLPLSILLTVPTSVFLMIKLLN